MLSELLAKHWALTQSTEVAVAPRSSKAWFELGTFKKVRGPSFQPEGAPDPPVPDPHREIGENGARIEPKQHRNGDSVLGKITTHGVLSTPLRTMNPPPHTPNQPTYIAGSASRYSARHLFRLAFGSSKQGRISPHSCRDSLAE